MSTNEEKSSLKQKWDSLPSEKKQRAITFGAAGVVLLLILSSYYGSGESERRNAPVVQIDKKKLNLGKDLLEDDIQQKISTDLKQQNEIIASSGQRVANMEELLPAIQEELKRLREDRAINAANNSLEEPDGSKPNTSQAYPTYNPPEGYKTADYGQPVGMPEVKIEVIGGVGHSQGEPQKKADNKKKQNSFYLAPGFMEAQLLHGVEAYTSEGALANPEPLLIRVQAPAVLPNDIKAQLSGCFVMANVHGSLAKERVEAQVVNLSCLSPDGTAVIDQEILGYVVDEDGKKGLHANIVTKMGQHVSRSFIAGLAGGIGEGVSLGGVQSNITGAGQVQSFDADRIAQTALGQGLKSATEDIKKLYMELARQTMPVAEIGAAKKCTVVIQKGVELVIRNRDTFKSDKLN